MDRLNKETDSNPKMPNKLKGLIMDPSTWLNEIQRFNEKQADIEYHHFLVQKGL